MTIGCILAVIFKLLSCRNIDGIYVHYYFGDSQCFDGIWFIALFALLLIIFLWIWFDVQLYKMNAIDRSSKRGNALFQLVRAYKDKYWYWETVLLSRRLILALCVMISDEDNYLKSTLIIFLCVYLIAHCWLKPFVHQRVNKLETECLIILIIMLVYMNWNTRHPKTEHNIAVLFLMACCISPILFVVYECGRLYIHKIMNEARISEDKLVELYRREEQKAKDPKQRTLPSPRHLKTLNQNKALVIDPITFEENENPNIEIKMNDVHKKMQSDLNTDDESSSSSSQHGDDDEINKQMNELFGDVSNTRSAAIESLCLEERFSQNISNRTTNKRHFSSQSLAEKMDMKFKRLKTGSKNRNMTNPMLQHDACSAPVQNDMHFNGSSFAKKIDKNDFIFTIDEGKEERNSNIQQNLTVSKDGLSLYDWTTV